MATTTAIDTLQEVFKALADPARLRNRDCRRYQTAIGPLPVLQTRGGGACCAPRR